MRYRLLRFAECFWRLGPLARSKARLVGLFLLVYQVAPLRVDLRSPVSFWGFLALALVAALAGSAGSFIWAHTNAVGLNQFYPVWQGWWLGGFLQSALITTPTLWLLGPVVLRKLTPLRGARSSEKVRRGPLLVAIFGVLGTLIGFVFIGRYFGLVRASMVESSLPVELRDDFQNVVSAFSSAQWIMMMAIALAGYFAYQSVIHWTTTLREANRELEQSNVRLTQLSTTDPLTGIFNRRQIFEVLAGEYSKARREGGALCVMMADLDHFKKINDQYGHQVGDFALQTAVSRINSVLRRYDRIGRYGGEEFLLILPGVDAEGALQVAARIVDAVRGQPVQADSTDFDMTVSVGLAALTSHDADVDALINRADKALYAAKSGGRDRVELAKPPEAISPSASRSEAD